MLLKVDCLPNAVGKQPSIPLNNLGRKWTLNRWWWWWWWWTTPTPLIDTSTGLPLYILYRLGCSVVGGRSRTLPSDVDDGRFKQILSDVYHQKGRILAETNRLHDAMHWCRMANQLDPSVYSPVEFIFLSLSSFLLHFVSSIISVLRWHDN